MYVYIYIYIYIYIYVYVDVGMVPDEGGDAVEAEPLRGTQVISFDDNDVLN